METRKKITRKNFSLLVLVCFLMVAGFSVQVLAKPVISVDVNVEPGKIKVGEDFNVIVTITNEDNDEKVEDSDDIEIKIYRGSTLIHEKEYNVPTDLDDGDEHEFNISSGDFRVDGDNIWERGLFDYDCDDFDIKVEVGGDVDEDEYTDDLEIEPDNNDYELYFSLSPENPTVDKDFKVEVTDEDDDELKSATVRLTQLGDDEEWDYDDPYRDKTTDSDGEADFDKINDDYKFEDEPYSKYKVDVWVEDKYCKVTKYFDTRRKLDITEIPSSLFVGKAIKVKVVDDSGNAVQGANVGVSKSGYNEFFTSDSGGYATFTLADSGSYTLVASKTGYEDSDLKTVTIDIRGTLSLEIKPSKEAVIGTAVTIIVKGNDDLLQKDAKVVITKPDGSEEVKTTPDTGQVSYTPSVAGTYNVKAEHASYLPKSDSFKALNEFTLTVPEAVLYEDLTLVAKDQKGILVEGATVSISGTTITGNTNSDGKFTFRLDTPGEYTITVKKTDFRDKTQNVNTLGILTLVISEKTVSVDGIVEFTVKDSQGNAVDGATIGITKPDGSADTASNSRYIPGAAGVYGVTASKANYKSAKDNFTANRLPLKLDVSVRGTTISALVTSNDEPVEGIPVQVETIFGGEELETDELGMVEIALVNITEKLNVTISVKDPKYEEVSVSRDVSPGSDLMNAAVFLIIVLVILVLVYFRMRKTKSGGGFKPRGGSGEVRSGGASLQKGAGMSLSGRKGDSGLRGL